eukprot:CAMPEP_0114438754 /NCGR_PEP_ID=MMETSP0103-20121206/14797_1 /TAXON_ID=37642 ORGANISM="Paraphysomonas imperforata, Strain PA2" /NCGR_SAMPLE_ID=MMETSP0103 /ASSEMBLY_ACC=CAM_ASM_000201 /LENGTH=101 /DNA_ID=CAMNT_0001609397 /DNA_START=695 /DNA_END=997 /DNA_ORIENTATION=+
MSTSARIFNRLFIADCLFRIFLSFFRNSESESENDESVELVVDLGESEPEPEDPKLPERIRDPACPLFLRTEINFSTLKDRFCFAANNLSMEHFVRFKDVW